MATLVTRSGKGSPLTHAEVDANFTNLNTDKLELSGGTMTGNLSFGDNDKAIFGAGSDLQIYHSGAASFISEAGTGNLFIEGSSEINFRNTAQTAYLMRLTDGGNVRLYHAGAQKLATTSTGIDVTGTVTADGLTVDGNGSLLTLDNGSNPATLSNTNGNVTLDFDTTNAGRNYIIQGNNLNVFKASNGGDISFYEDTGTTAKFFWDASAESLGIGTTSPSGLFHAKDASSSFMFKDVSGNAKIFLDGSNGDFAGGDYMEIEVDSSPNLMFKQAGTERMRIDSSGRVGIGTSSPDTALNVVSSSTQAKFEGSVQGNIIIEKSGTEGMGLYSNAAGTLAFYDNNSGTERMRIDSSGNLLVGTTETYPGAGTAENRIGISIENTYGIHASTNGQRSLLLNRMTSDGNIAEFRKDGTTVGSIGAQGTAMTIGNGVTGLRFSAAGYVHPHNITTNVASNGTTDLGASTTRFKDLYLSGGVKNSSGNLLLEVPETSGAAVKVLFGDISNTTRRTVEFYKDNVRPASADDGDIDLGYPTQRWRNLYLSSGVYLGGTGSANKLDDYEYGDYQVTFTPSGGGSITLLGSHDDLKYTKIGSRVFVTGKVDISAASSPSGYIAVTLPFAIHNSGTANDSRRFTGSVWVINAAIETYKFQLYGVEGESSVRIYNGSGTGLASTSANQFSGDEGVAFSFNYETTP